MIRVTNLTHRYGERIAVNDVSLEVRPAEIFGFLGPNGSGKTTLFRILSTLITPQQGQVAFSLPNSELATRNSELSLPKDQQSIRKLIGVVFQSPSLDKQLTAEENLRHHGHLYGLRGAELETRIDQMLARVGLDSRPKELVAKFSGGMRRRVELAKGLLTRPKGAAIGRAEHRPGTPAPRIDLCDTSAKSARRKTSPSSLPLTSWTKPNIATRLAIMDDGHLAACDTPANLKSRIGADVITLQSDTPATLATEIQLKFQIKVDQIDQTLRIEREKAHEFIPPLVEAFRARSARSHSASRRSKTSSSKSPGTGSKINSAPPFPSLLRRRWRSGFVELFAMRKVQMKRMVGSRPLFIHRLVDLFHKPLRACGFFQHLHRRIVIIHSIELMRDAIEHP